MTAGTAPTAYDLVATQGADFSILFSFTQAAGGLTGTTATCSVLNTSGTPAVVSSFTGSLNVTSDTTATFAASLTSAQIATLVATGSTTFRYALNSTKSALVTPWLAGALTFLQPGVGSTTASGSFTITAGSNTITGSLTVAANAASNVSFTPTGTIASTNVQTAIAEVASEAVQVSDLAPRLNGQRFVPSGAIAATLPRNLVTSNGITSLSTGRQTFYLIWLPAVTINSISFVSGATGAGSPTNQWFSIYDANRNKLAVTLDDTSTGWASNSVKTLSISGGYTIPTEGYYYFGIMVAATTVPSLAGIAFPATVNLSTVPVISGFDATNTGLTTPGTAPATAAALTVAGASPAYVYCS